MKKKPLKKSKLDQPVTLGVLMEFTDEVLLPRLSDMMDERFKEADKKTDQKLGKLEYKLKVYIDEKMAEYTSEIFKRLEKKYQEDRSFKRKVIEILKKNHLGSVEEIAFLEGMVAGN